MIYLSLQIAVKAFTGLLAIFALVAAVAILSHKVRASVLARLKKGVLAALFICAADSGRDSVPEFRSSLRCLGHDG